VDFLLESSTTPAKADDILVAGSITYGSVGLRFAKQRRQAGRLTAFGKTRTSLAIFLRRFSWARSHLYTVTGAKPLTSDRRHASLH